VVHHSFIALEKYAVAEYSNLGIEHVAEDTFTIGKGEAKLTVIYKPGDVIFFQVPSGTPNGYFTIKSNPGGPKLFLKDSGEGMFPDQAAEYLVKLVTVSD
jgi:hypothetical protein